MLCFSGVIVTSVPKGRCALLGSPGSEARVGGETALSGVKQGSMARPAAVGEGGAPGHCCSRSSLGPVRLGSLERCLLREGALSVEVPEEVLPALLPGLRSCHLGDALPEGLRWAGGRPRAQVRPARCRFLHGPPVRSLLPGHWPSLVGRRQSGVDPPRGPRVTCPAGFLRGAPGLATQQAPEGLGTLPGRLTFWKILQPDLWRRVTPFSTS